MVTIWQNSKILDKAAGKVFNAVRVLPRASRVVFIKVWPSGNIAVKYEKDPEHFGPITISPEKAKPLADAIEFWFNNNFKG